MAKKKLTESEIARTYEVVKGFNDGRQDGKRFDANGKTFVTEQDFAPETWKSLVKADAVRLVEKPLSEAEKEEIVFVEVKD